jgi:hypothetical protein
MRQRMVSFPEPAGALVELEFACCLLKLSQGYPQPPGTLVKVLRSLNISMRIGLQG